MFDAFKTIDELEARLAHAQETIARMTTEAEQARMRSIATVLERDHYKSRAEGKDASVTAQLVDALQDAVKETREMAANALAECESMRFAIIDARNQLCEWRRCCTMFFHVAGKPEAESWAQFEKAAELYHALNDAYGEQHPCDHCNECE